MDLHLVTDPKLIAFILGDSGAVFSKARADRRWSAFFGPVLLTQEGEAHRAQRAEASRFFSASRLEAMALVFERHVELALARWASGRETLSELAIERLWLRANAEIFWGEALPEDATDRVLFALAGLSAAARRAAWEARWRDYAGYVAQAFRARRALRGTRGCAPPPRFPWRFSRRALASPMNLLLAGWKTTTHVMRVLFSALAADPAFQAELAAELVGRPESRGRELLDAAIREALRWDPPVATVLRAALETVELPGARFEKGALLTLAVDSAQRHPDYFLSPERFVPSRWLDAGAAARGSEAFFPFGQGPHRCVGERLAWSQVRLLFRPLLARFAIVPASSGFVALAPRGETTASERREAVRKADEHALRHGGGVSGEAAVDEAPGRIATV